MDDRLIWGDEKMEEVWRQTLYVGEYGVDEIRAAQEFISSERLRVELLCQSQAVDSDKYYVGVRRASHDQSYLPIYHDQLLVYLLLKGSIPLEAALGFEDFQSPLPTALRDAALIALAESSKQIESVRQKIENARVR